MTTNVPALDRAVQQTQAWLGHIAQDMGWDDHERSYQALRAVLHTLRDRLPPAEAINLAARLPMLVRGCFFEGWDPAGKPLPCRDRQAFLAQVREAAPDLKPREIERAAVAVLRELSTELHCREVAQARDALPAVLRDLWPRAEA